jgi:small subunit ribosomal protein S3
LRANIDYGFAEANTTYGKIGVKVWIFKGEVIGKPEIKEEKPTVGFSTTETGRRIDLISRERETEESAVESPKIRRERRPSDERPARDRRTRQRTDRTGRGPTAGRRERRPTGGRPVPTGPRENRRRRNLPQE